MFVSICMRARVRACVRARIILLGPILYYYVSGRSVCVRVSVRVCIYVHSNVYAYVCAGESAYMRAGATAYACAHASARV